MPSSDEAEALDNAEAEARLDPITRAHVEAFDKIKLRKKRKLRDDAYWRQELGFDTEDEEFRVTEQDFVNLFRAHVKRKKLRKIFGFIAFVPEAIWWIAHMIWYNVQHYPYVPLMAFIYKIY